VALSFCTSGQCGYEKAEDAGFVPVCVPNACANGCTRQTVQAACCRSDNQCGCQYTGGACD
jgi:hypothetical protein